MVAILDESDSSDSSTMASFCANGVRAKETTPAMNASRHIIDEGGAGHDRRKYAVEAGGMDAILGSLYESARSGVPFHGEPLSDVRQKQKGTRGRGGRSEWSGGPRRGQTIESYSYFDDEAPIAKKDLKEVDKSKQFRRSTMTSYDDRLAPAAEKDFKDEEAKSYKPLRRSTMTDAYDYEDGPTPPSKKVSWSNLHSVSLFDLDKSPGAAVSMSKMNVERREDAFPVPPLSLEKTAPPRSGLWQEHSRWRPKKEERPEAKLQSAIKGSGKPIKVKQTEVARKPIKVISLPWTDHRGVHGYYTGEVNTAIQPHGKGSFHSSEDEDALDEPAVIYASATWKDGQLVSAKVPLNYSLNDSKDSSPHRAPSAKIPTDYSLRDASSGPLLRRDSSFRSSEMPLPDDPREPSASSMRRGGPSAKIPMDYSLRDASSGPLLRRNSLSGSTETQLLDDLREPSASSLRKEGPSAKIPMDYSLKDASSIPLLRRKSSSGSAETQLRDDPREDGVAKRSARSNRPDRPLKSLSRGGSDSTLNAFSSPANVDGNFENNGRNGSGQQQPQTTPFCENSTKSRVKATSLPGYQLGHSAKCRTHMIILPSGSDLQVAISNALSLRPLDFAFVLRSDTTWTYSIVADKPIVEDGPAIRFVLDGHGSTKTIRKKYWAKGIRLLNPAVHSVLANNLDNEDNVDDDGDYPVSEEESSVCREMMGSHRSPSSPKSCKKMKNSQKRGHKNKNEDVLDRESPVSEKESSVVKMMAGRRRSEGDSGSPITKKMSKKMSNRRATVEGTRPENASISMSLTSGFTDVAVIAPSEARGPWIFHDYVEGDASQEKDKRRTRREPARSGPANTSMNSGLSNVAVVAPTERFYDREEECCESVSLEEEEEEECCDGVGPEEEGTGFAEGETLRRTSMNSGFSNAAVVAPATGGGFDDGDHECYDDVCPEREGTSSAEGETSQKPKRGSMSSRFANVAVIAPTMAGFEDSSNSECCDGVDPEEEEKSSVEMTGNAHLVDESERTAESLDSKLRAMLSLDYLGTMEDSDEEEHMEEQKCGLYGSSHNNEFTKSHSSFHASCHTVNWRDWDGDGTGKGRGDSPHPPYALCKKTSSFHHPAAAGLVRASRRGSTGSVSFHDHVSEEGVGATGGFCWKRRRSGASGTASLGTSVHEKCSIASCLEYERRRHLDDEELACLDGDDSSELKE